MLRKTLKQLLDWKKYTSLRRKWKYRRCVVLFGPYKDELFNRGRENWDVWEKDTVGAIRKFRNFLSYTNALKYAKEFNLPIMRVEEDNAYILRP